MEYLGNLHSPLGTRKHFFSAAAVNFVAFAEEWFLHVCWGVCHTAGVNPSQSEACKSSLRTMSPPSRLLPPTLHQSLSPHLLQARNQNPCRRGIKIRVLCTVISSCSTRSS